jgi:chemotaxis signal transduction protein
MHDYNLFNMTGDIQVFRFWVEKVPYALRIEHVLAISQDMSRLREMPGDLPGFLGLIDYQGTVVPVIDFAHMLGRRNEAERKEELIALLSAREKDHLEWLAALEHSLREGVPFTKERNPDRCAFGQWYASYKPQDDALAMVYSDFDAPHRRIHALADELLQLASREDREAALQRLDLERQTTFRVLQRTFNFVRDALRSSQHAVLLYITSDGRTPRMALRIDDISDILTFSERERVPLDRIGLPAGAISRDLVSDYLRGKAGDVLLLEPDTLVRLADQARARAG